MGRLLPTKSMKHGSKYLMTKMHLVVERGHLQKSKNSIAQNACKKILTQKRSQPNYVAHDWKHVDWPNPVHGLDQLENGSVVRDGN